MKLVDLSVNCIQETVRDDNNNEINYATIISGDLTTSFKYGTELNNVLLSVNKAIMRFTSTDKIDYVEAKLTTTTSTFEYDLDDMLEENFTVGVKKHYGIKNVKACYYIIDGVIISTPYQVVGKSLIVSRPINGTLRVIFAPYIKQFTWAELTLPYTRDDAITDLKPNPTEDDYQYELSDIGITDEMCQNINYFAKSELYEDRDADRCKRYLNYFESFLNNFNVTHNLPHQKAVDSKYVIDNDNANTDFDYPLNVYLK